MFSKLVRKYAYEMFVKRRKKVKGTIAWLLAFGMLIGTMGMIGCGRTETEGSDGNLGNEGAMKEEGTNEGEGSREGLAVDEKEKVMGRYLEYTIDSLKGELDLSSSIARMEDGSLVIMSGSAGKWVSMDNGDTWERESMAWHEELKDAGVWFMKTAVAKDGTIAVIYAGGEENDKTVSESGEGEGDEGEDDDGTDEGEEETQNWNLSFHPKYGIAYPNGTFVKLNIPYKKSEYVDCLAFSEDGRLFGTVLGGKVYEIDKETGSCEELIELSSSAHYIVEKDNRLALVYGGGVAIVDLDRGEMIEDKVLDDFIRDQFGSRVDYNVEGVQPLLVLPDAEGILYLIFEKGIYRHVVGGNVMEQVLDGSLTSLINPSYGIADGTLLENDEFLLLFSGGEIKRYAYDPNTSAVPEVQLRAYSLRENEQFKTVISAFQAEHPEAYIRYEAGMEENSAITREDALKKLNTEIAAGKGPDIFLLDDMPIDSYIEKGVLMDLTPYLENKAEDKYFTGVINAFRREEGTYVAPAQFRVALMAGKQSDIEKMTDLETIVRAVETYREEKAEGAILGVRSEDELLNLLLPVCAPAWKDGEGKIDKAALTEFYAAAKRIWEAESVGISDEVKELYEEWLEDIRLSGISDDELKEFQSSLSGKTSGWLAGERKFIAGMLRDGSSLDTIISCFKTEGKEDGAFAAYNGQSKGVFVPLSLMGISRTAGNTEIAVELLERMLDDDGWGGMPVNKEEWMEIVHMHATEDGSPYASVGGSSEDGSRFYYLDIYSASEEEIALLAKITEEADTPYVRDPVLEKAVCEAGLKVLRGEMDASGGAQEVIQRTAIYMAE